MHFTDSRTLECDCSRCFRMIADIERYPEFLPGWVDARVLSEHGDRQQVIQTVRAGPLPVTFRTEAFRDPPHRLSIRGRDGPFRRLQIDWRLEPVDGYGCRIQLAVEADMRFGPLARGVEHLFRRQARELLNHFERRARALGLVTTDLSPQDPTGRLPRP